jgi:hypothetical protein
MSTADDEMVEGGYVHWKVERIIACRVPAGLEEGTQQRKELEYLVWWKDSDDATWEKFENLVIGRQVLGVTR